MLFRSKIIEKYKIEEFFPNLSSILLTPCEYLENYTSPNNELSLENTMNKIKYYSNIGIPENEEDKHKQTFLDKLRSDQSERVKENWKLMQ